MPVSRASRIALSPPGLPPSEAASLVVAATTALTALRDSPGLVSGERVLVRGAAGGVGTAAVQYVTSGALRRW